MMVHLWMRKRNKRLRWEQYEEYHGIWQMRWTTCLIVIKMSVIGVLTHWIGSCTCNIGNGILNIIQITLKFQY
jgi:hypothetical protein